MECGTGKREVKSCLYFTISRLFRIVNKVAEESFSELDICPTHAFLMLILQDKPKGMSVNEISEALTIAPSTVTRFVDKLIIKKYVERVKSGKQSFTKLTRTGKNMIPKVYECWEVLFKGVENLIDDKDYLYQIAGKIIEFTELIEENQKRKEIEL